MGGPSTKFTDRLLFVTPRVNDKGGSPHQLLPTSQMIVDAQASLKVEGSRWSYTDFDEKCLQKFAVLTARAD